MRPRAIILLGLLIGTAAVAKDKAPSLLSAGDLDPRAVLPLPPAAGSAQATAELAELHAMQLRRTPAEMAAAKIDGDTKTVAMFADVLGPRFDLDRLPATARLFEAVHATEKDVVDRGKDEFRRQRPWIVDPTIVSCSRSEDPLSSYPSGHATFAFSMAGVLARLVPSHAAAVLERAHQFAETRITCEQHFRSDVTAGEILGTIVAERLMTKPAFAPMVADARRELTAAGLR
ncbi:MAG: phosphatase PAP2 family protein [Sphingomonas sp.]|uniref:phosphatase PAP2 family protein n=1 Tax=Sphingomonas sp. TaxID=28214 RepID=UPI001AD188AF|nr:phosphatase PAP2 family protein [Sphingomonas sp.]MBN8809351.1 phosphatase PAP2 family protein [Sphingomonas sp.]